MAKRQKDEQSSGAIAMLKADHQKVRDLFLEYEAARDQRARREVAETIFLELDLHARTEEHVFYPAFEEAAEEGQELVRESLKEHEAVTELIEELRTLDTGSELFQTKFRELRDNVEHHVRDEEGRMFPQAEREMEERLEDLKDEMQEYKQALQAS
jgi:hypothetical protein